MRNKYLRYILGFFLLGIIIFSLFISKVMLFIVSIFFIIISMKEYRNMFKSKNIFPHIIIPEFIGSFFAYLYIFGNQMQEQNSFILLLLILSIIISFLITIITKNKPYFENTMSTIAGVMFIFLGLYIIKISFLLEEKESVRLILVYFFSVLTGDYMASIIGPKCKRYLLSKEISPNKTILGSIINLLSTCLICTFLNGIISLTECIILGILISVFSQIGDLSVSTIKRELGIKHSGNLFGEYGGIFDRIDAFIFSAPIVYYYFYINELLKVYKIVL